MQFPGHEAHPRAPGQEQPREEHMALVHQPKEEKRGSEDGGNIKPGSQWKPQNEFTLSQEINELQEQIL